MKPCSWWRRTVYRLAVALAGPPEVVIHFLEDDRLVRADSPMDLALRLVFKHSRPEPEPGEEWKEGR